MTTSGVSFTPAAKYYNATRALPEDAMTVMIRMLEKELDGRGPCLEVGAGTGRMLVPLAQAGIPICGIDLSLAMLRQSRLELRLPIAQASATNLPFPNESFGSAIACLALHTIPDWKRVVDEVVRVVVPGGPFLVQPPWPWEMPMVGEMWVHFAGQVGITRPHPGLQNLEELDLYCLSNGIGVAELPLQHFDCQLSILDVLEQLKKRVYAWTWDITRVDMTRGLAETRAWAEERFGSLDEKRELRTPLVWRRYTIPT